MPTPYATVVLNLAQNPPRVRPSLSAAQESTCIHKTSFKRTRILNTCFDRKLSLRISRSQVTSKELKLSSCCRLSHHILRKEMGCL